MTRYQHNCTNAISLQTAELCSYRAVIYHGTNAKTVPSDLVKLLSRGKETVGLIAAKFIKNKTEIQPTHFFLKSEGWINLIPNCQYSHSVENKNCEIVTRENTKYLVSLRDIKIGEEILVDYTEDGDLNQQQAGWKRENDI